jgi:hypothetical protein
MKKVAKIVSCYPYLKSRGKLGNTGNVKTIEAWEARISKMVEMERTIDHGGDVQLDLFLIYRSEPDQEKPSAEFINKFHGQKTFSGNIIVHEFENDDAHGFSSIKFVLQYYGHQYDYLIYQEDDIILSESAEGYIGTSIKQIEDGAKVVAYSTFVERRPHELTKRGSPHVGGTYVFVPVKDLLVNLDTFPMTKQTTEIQSSRWIFNSVGATITDIHQLEGYCNYPENVNNIKIFHQGYVKEKWTSGKFLFRIGL